MIDQKNPPQSAEVRLGEHLLKKRLALESNFHHAEFTVAGFKITYMEAQKVFDLFYGLLGKTPLAKRGLKNCLDYELIDRKVSFKNLPTSFQGFRILHLSDLHIDEVMDGGKKLAEEISRLRFDICMITGDFRYELYGDFNKVMKFMGPVISAARRCTHGVYGILGNHDSIHMVAGFETMGMRMLINENLFIQKQEHSVALIGVDDPHYYRTHDLKKATDGISEASFKILLAHSSEIIHEAHEAKIDFYLCGHSHGGQICFPRNYPLAKNTSTPRQFMSGAWTHQNLKGYTSRGAGATGMPIRFLCRPEITIHELTTT